MNTSWCFWHATAFFVCHYKRRIDLFGDGIFRIGRWFRWLQIKWKNGRWLNLIYTWTACPVRSAFPLQFDCRNRFAVAANFARFRYLWSKRLCTDGGRWRGTRSATGLATGFTWFTRRVRVFVVGHFIGMSTENADHFCTLAAKCATRPHVRSTPTDKRRRHSPVF